MLQFGVSSMNFALLSIATTLFAVKSVGVIVSTSLCLLS